MFRIFLKNACTIPITLVLILLSVLGALIVQFNSQLVWEHWLTLATYFQDPIILISRNPWRLITPAFLHFGFAHLLLNSLSLLDFGRRLELYAGKIQLLVFFIFTGVIANLVQFAWNVLFLKMPYLEFGGMSGVVYALFGFIIVAQRFSNNPLVKFPKKAFYFMLGWMAFISIFFYLILHGNLASAAHIGGFVAGLLYGIVYFMLKKDVLKS